MIGLPATWRSGLGQVSVAGRSRSPFPPAMIMAVRGSCDRVRVVSMRSVIRPFWSRRGMRRMPWLRNSRMVVIWSVVWLCGVMARKLRCIIVSTVSVSDAPSSSPRRMSPSVSVPVILRSLSVTASVMTPPERLLSRRSASMMVAFSVIICCCIWCGVSFWVVQIYIKIPRFLHRQNKKSRLTTLFLPPPTYSKSQFY